MYKYKILNFTGGFAPFTSTAFQYETEADGASIADGADADDMAKMNRRSLRASGGLAISQKAIGSLGMAGVKRQIERAIERDMKTETASITPTKVALYSVVLKKNKLEPNYLKFIEADRVPKITDIHQARLVARKLRSCGMHNGVSCIRPDTDGTLGAYNIYIYIVVIKQ